MATTILFVLGACSTHSISNMPSYKLKVIQGNELDEEALSHLQKGMNKPQVQMLLGTPLLRDPFHRNRWDYLFAVTRNGVVKENKSLTIYFDEHDEVINIEGDGLPAPTEPTEASQPQQ